MSIGHHHPGADAAAHPYRAYLLPAAVAGCMVLSAVGLPSRLLGVSLNAWAAVMGSLPILWLAWRELRQGRLSADLAVCLAAAAALAVGESLVAAEVILIMLIGSLLEDFAVGRTRSAIAALVRLSPRTATRLHGDAHETVDLAALQAGDCVLVAPGERVPVDGQVETGHSSVDQSALTGESLPVDIGPGDAVLAGSLNGNGPLQVRTVRVGPDSAFGRMIHLVEMAEAAKAPAQRLADRLASYFLPVVLACAGAVYLWSGELLRAVTVLVVACPCALVLATPTAISAGIGRLARRGVLVKGGAPLEALGRSRTLLLDKTGTLTLARLSLVDVLPAAGWQSATVLRLAAALERLSGHPLAKAIAEAGGRRAGPLPQATEASAVPGRGVLGTVEGHNVRIGSLEFLRGSGVPVPPAVVSAADALQRDGKAVAAMAVDGAYAGLLAAADQARPEARSAIAALMSLYDGAVTMLTGDSPGAADYLGRQLGIQNIRAGLLPDDKARIAAELRRQSGPVVMVGDGINDAAALSAADVGIALTDAGSDAAIEAAGIAVLGDRHLEKVAETVVLARRVLRTVRQNVVLFAAGVNTVAVVAAGLGAFGPVGGAILHQAGSLLVVLNSLRLLWDRRAAGHLGARWAAVAAEALQRHLAGAAAGLGILYAASGCFVVRSDEVGVVRWFGRAGEIRPPGLHYRLPWPMARLDRVRPRQVQRLEIGFRTGGSLAGGPLPADWGVQHRGEGYASVVEEALITCGDHTFLDVTAVVHHRVADPVAYLFAAAERDALLRAAAESALREAVGRRGLQRVLTVERQDVEAEATAGTQQAIAVMGLGLAIERVHLADVHPPVEVVPSFRRVIDALEAKDATVNQAQAYAKEQLPLARGTAAVNRTAARAEASQDKAEATAGAGGFTARRLAHAEATPAGREALVFRLYAEYIEKALQGRRLTIVDPDLPGRTGLTLLDPRLVGQEGAASAATAAALDRSGDDGAPAAPPAQDRTVEPAP